MSLWHFTLHARLSFLEAQGEYIVFVRSDGKSFSLSSSSDDGGNLFKFGRSATWMCFAVATVVFF